MKILVYDKNYRFDKAIDGWYDADSKQFKYATYKSFLGIHYGKTEYSMPLDYNYAYDGITKGTKTAFVVYDGREYVQVTLEDINSKAQLSKVDRKTAYSDFQRDFKILDNAKKRALTQPKSLMKDVTEILFIITAAVLLIASYSVVRGVNTHLAALTSALNKTANNGAATNLEILNATRLLNKTIVAQQSEINYLIGLKNTNLTVIP
jgi:hypothetical protein